LYLINDIPISEFPQLTVSVNYIQAKGRLAEWLADTERGIENSVKKVSCCQYSSEISLVLGWLRFLVDSDYCHFEGVSRDNEFTTP
jgi:hypothetical protein